MAGLQHEIPTHLQVEDRVLGLSMRQVLGLVAGAVLSDQLWEQWPDTPTGLRLALAATGVALTLVAAFVRPAGRGLEDWLFVALRFAAVPKQRVWRPSPNDTETADDGAGWLDLEIGGRQTMEARHG